MGTQTDATLDGVHGGLLGFVVSNYTNNNAGNITNCVVIGIKPYATSSCTANNNVQHSGLETHFANIYTDQPAGDKVFIGGNLTRNFTNRVFQLAEAQMQGSAAVANMKLDWSVWMADDNGYPELRNAHKNITTVDNGDGTHSEVCECGFGGVRVDHIWVDGECACGAELDCAGRKTIYWDGTKASGLSKGTGTEDDPYIITTAAELAYVVGQKAADYTITDGKYFKVDDSIGAIVLQPESKAADIMALSSAADVKSYFENGSGFHSWQNYGWEGSTFCGVLDFNGVTIYGLYQKDSPNNAALIANIDAGAVIRNVALKNSYLTSAAPKADYQVGGLVANVNGKNYAKMTNGIVWFDSCVVANNYMYNNSTSHDRSGVIIGASASEAIYVDNCLVYGNDATYGDAVTMPIWSSASNVIIVDDNIVAPKGLELVDDGAETDPRYYNKVRNSIIFGAKPYDLAQNTGSRFNDPKCYENVLTDADPTTDLFPGDKTMTVTDEQMKTVTSVADLANANLGDAWIITDSDIDLKAFHDEVFTGAPSSEDAYAGHIAACSCGFGAGSVTAHEYNDAFTCEVCEFTCDHGEGSGYTKTPTAGDCITDTTYVGNCPCGYTDDGVETPKTGHTFTDVPAEPAANCQTTGTIAHKYCSVCEKNYATDADEFEPFENALASIEGEKGACVPAEDDSGLVYGADGTNHWTTCSVCEEIIETTAHTGEVTANGAAGHSFKCDVCLNEEDNAPHGFGDDSICDTCNWTCSAHVWVDDGEPVELGMAATQDVCMKVAQKCEICGIAGEDRTIGHEAGDWETPSMDMNKVYACAGDGQHTEVKICQVCFFEVARQIVTDPKTGHSFVEYEAEDPTCATTGSIAYKQCEVCWNSFALDAAEDEAYENALSYEEIEIPVDSTKHNWEEISFDATCDEDGIVAHQFCLDCYAILVDEEMVEADWDAYYEYDENGNPVGAGAILDSSYSKFENEALADFIAKNYADSGIEVPEYPAEDATFEEMNAYYEIYDAIFPALYAIDENVYTAWEEYWLPLWADTQLATRYLYVVATATEAGIDLVIPATGHTLVAKDEVAATYEADGTKAHWVCEDCGKLFSDAEGENEVTAEELVIAKLVKEEEKPADKPQGDDSTTSPVTGESVASVAAVAALMGAAFVLVRKSKKA